MAEYSFSTTNVLKLGISIYRKTEYGRLNVRKIKYRNTEKKHKYGGKSQNTEIRSFIALK